MNRKTKPMGRWQTWESLPNELQNLISHCPCGKCAKCICWDWYNKKKNKGFSAEELDDLIMKEGKYGKYYTEDSITETRHDAYATKNFQYGNQSCPVIKHYRQNLTISDILHKPNVINI